MGAATGPMGFGTEAAQIAVRIRLGVSESPTHLAPAG